jgi:hypothetical protein
MAGFADFGLVRTKGVAHLRHELSQAHGVAGRFAKAGLTVNVDEFAHRRRHSRVADGGRKLQRRLRFEALDAALI